jgi:beta-lactam-binding protein with PASTA domain
MTKRDANERTASYVIELPSSLKSAPAPILPRAVPDVRGLSVREAVRTLHGAGFRVRILASSPEGTLPAAGTLVAPGTIVQLSRPLE